ncbi:MAG: hypothetical protein LAT63_10635 [Marinobacter sp.]|nr:hypothetical protein [Marinobacter sp.]
MQELMAWLANYSPGIVLLLAIGAALIFLLKLVVEKVVSTQFSLQSKQLEIHFARRSAFEEKVLAERFALVNGLSARLEQVMTDLNRARSGQPLQEGVMRGNELVPLTTLFVDLEIHRLLLGEGFYELFTRMAQTALATAKQVQAGDSGAWEQLSRQWVTLRAELRGAADDAFGLSRIHW